MSTLRVLLCGLSILASIIFALCVIIKYERSKRQHSRNEEEEEEYIGVVYEDDVWKTCCKRILPAILMAYRIFAFLILLILFSLHTIASGRRFPFFYYTEWTSVLIIIYFMLGSLLSIYGCYRKVHDDRSRVIDEEHPTNERRPDKVAGLWGYVFQIIFQMLAGAVVHASVLYWFIVYPAIVIKINRKLDYIDIIDIILISGILILFLFEAAFNSLRFPWFRIAYFVLWTCSYVVFHWILHAFRAIGWPYAWPYALLNLTSYPSAPLWYFFLALSHVPFYTVIFGLIKLIRFVLKNFIQDG